MRLVALLLVVVLSGCVNSEPTKATPDEGPKPIGWIGNTYIVDGGERRPFTHASIKEIEGGFEIDTLAAYGRDQVSFWLVEANEPLTMDFTTDYEFTLVNDALAEGSRPLNGCLQTGRLKDSSAQYMLNRAMGQNHSAPVDDSGDGWTTNSASGGGTFTGSSLKEGHAMAAGEKALLVMVYSQFSVGDIESGHSKFTVQSAGNFSVTVLPPAPWVCSFTFASAWEGATFQKAGLTNYQEGGHLELNLPYGGSMHACGQSPTGAIGTTTTENSATLRFGDEEKTIKDSIPFRAESLNSTAASIDVGRWVGTPFFEVRGLPWALGGHTVNCN